MPHSILFCLNETSSIQRQKDLAEYGYDVGRPLCLSADDIGVLFAQRYIKYVKNLMSIVACGDFCCLAPRADPDATTVNGQWVIVLCNAIGKCEILTKVLFN